MSLKSGFNSPQNQKVPSSAWSLFTPLSLLPFQLAPSPAVVAYLTRTGRLKSFNMALMTVEKVANPKVEPQILAVPLVLTTPCDPWPRPYYLEDGLRKVLPYHFTYNTFCKERWRGRELIDIFATEFRDRPQAYYVSETSKFG